MDVECLWRNPIQKKKKKVKNVLQKLKEKKKNIQRIYGYQKCLHNLTFVNNKWFSLWSIYGQVSDQFDTISIL